MSGLFGRPFRLHEPVVHTRDGADHVGVDAILRCKRCGATNGEGFECWKVTPEIERKLEHAWRRNPPRAECRQ